MTKKQLLIEQLNRAVQRLQEALNEPKTTFLRDASIQRFEFCFDLSWKTLKVCLEADKGVVCQSPKDCFRRAYQAELIAYDDFWITLTDLRNETSHTYHEAMAEKVYEALPKALKHFQELTKILK